MNKPKLGTDESQNQQMKEELQRLQEQIKQQQAYLNHLKWKESASI